VQAEVAVVGCGVVGSAVGLALARRGAAVAILEAEPEPGLAASGTNSGILHTGFDSLPGELESQLIVRSAALRDPVLEVLRVPVLRCGALMRPADGSQREAVAGLAANAERNGVEVSLHDDGALEVPGESVTDPVAYTLALAAAAQRHGAELRTGFRVAGLQRSGGGIIVSEPGGDSVTARLVVNCAGLGKIIAGPTAVDQQDKGDWSVRPQARDEILPKATAMYPPLQDAEPIAAYAGLRPAGHGVNYLIGPSEAFPGLVNVAAIRSTGLSASLGIAERVCEIVRELGVALTPEQPLEPGRADGFSGPWWQRSARYRLP